MLSRLFVAEKGIDGWNAKLECTRYLYLYGNITMYTRWMDFSIFEMDDGWKRLERLELFQLCR